MSAQAQLEVIRKMVGQLNSKRPKCKEVGASYDFRGREGVVKIKYKGTTHFPVDDLRVSRGTVCGFEALSILHPER